jgi:hypothetical protein
MGQKMVISEQEKNEILRQYHLINESISTTIANKLSGTKLYQLVDKSWDSNPMIFVKNILQEIPSLKNKQSELSQKVTNITKMDDNQKISFINGNRSTVEKEISNTEKSLTEQVMLWYTIAAVVFIYCIIGIVRMEKMRKTDPEKYDKIKNPPMSLTDDETATQELSDLIGKTINLYNSSDERDLNQRIKILGIKFKSYKASGGWVQFKTMSEAYSVGCLVNPDELAHNIQKSNSISNYYNEKFTTLLNEKVGRFCKKPSADFGSIPNKNIDPSKMG